MLLGPSTNYYWSRIPGPLWIDGPDTYVNRTKVSIHMASRLAVWLVS